MTLEDLESFIRWNDHNNTLGDDPYDKDDLVETVKLMVEESR